MSNETKLKKKILYPYIIFGFILFVILYVVNLTYNKFIFGLTIGHNYNISATQYYGFKYKTYEELFDDIFSYDINTLHRIKKVNVDPEGLTITRPKSTLFFKLILTDYVPEEELTKIINKRYLGQINEVINELENTSNSWDMELIKSSYEKLREKKLNESYNSFIKSEFFKKYPSLQCNETPEYCLKMYHNLYLFVFDNLSLSNKDLIKKFLNVDETKNISFAEIFKDLNLNKNLYINLDPDIIINEENYYLVKFNNLLNSSTYKNYILNNFCTTYEKSCLNNISKEFSRVLYKHKQEKNHSFEVKYLKPKEKQKFHFIFEAIKVLGFTLLITYILFVLTNKFLARRLK